MPDARGCRPASSSRSPQRAEAGRLTLGSPHVWNGERWVPLTPQDDTRAVDRPDRSASGAGLWYRVACPGRGACYGHPGFCSCCNTVSCLSTRTDSCMRNTCAIVRSVVASGGLSMTVEIARAITQGEQAGAAVEECARRHRVKTYVAHARGFVGSRAPRQGPRHRPRWSLTGLPDRGTTDRGKSGYA